MLKVLIGSAAAPDGSLKSQPKDRDYFLLEGSQIGTHVLEKEDGKHTEGFFHPDLKKWDWSGPVASLDELYTIKVSHSFWELKNNSWDKHMFHILMMKKSGAQFLPDLHNILYPIWVEIHGKKNANLEQEPDQFFNSNINRVYEHDSIHASVAYYDEPLFNRILRDNHAVAVDRSKFDAMPLDDKLKLVREEVYATALERRLIPVDYKLNQKAAYNYALKKTVTSFTKGWFPLFIVLNFDELKSPTENFVEKHLENKDRLIKLS